MDGNGDAGEDGEELVMFGTMVMHDVIAGRPPPVQRGWFAGGAAAGVRGNDVRGNGVRGNAPGELATFREPLLPETITYEPADGSVGERVVYRRVDSEVVKDVVEHLPAQWTPRQKLLWCLGVNVALLLFVVLLICSLNDGKSSYFRWGPNDNLVVLTVHVNTWASYAGILAVLFIIRFIEVILSDIAAPIIQFTVYDPYKVDIQEFGRIELQVMTILMIMISAARAVILFVVAVTQIDIAMWSSGVQCMATVWTTYYLTKHKRFAGETVEVNGSNVV